MKNCIYFAAGLYDNGKGKLVFELVRPSGPNALPYLTRNAKGLVLTSHHANLYRLDGDKAVLADFRSIKMGCAYEVPLRTDQLEQIRKAIEVDHFYD